MHLNIGLWSTLSLLSFIFLSVLLSLHLVCSSFLLFKVAVLVIDMETSFVIKVFETIYLLLSGTLATVHIFYHVVF